MEKRRVSGSHGRFGDKLLQDKPGDKIQPHIINKFNWELFVGTETRSHHGIKIPRFPLSWSARFGHQSKGKKNIDRSVSGQEEQNLALW